MNPLLMSDKLRKRLEEPFVAEWALLRLANEQVADPAGATEAIQLLFDDSTAPATFRSLLARGDHDTLAAMFCALPPERFQGVTDLLLESWPDWQDNLACESAPALAQLAPEAAARLFSEFIASPGLLDDLSKLGGVLQALRLLPAPTGIELARQLLALDKTDRDLRVAQLGLLEAIRVAWTHELPILDELLMDLVTDPGKVALANVSLPYVYRVLTNDASFFDHITDLREGETEQTFSPLAPLFDPGAPLAELDRLVQAGEPTGIGDAFDFLCVACEGREDRCLAALRGVPADRRALVQPEVKAAMAQFFLAAGAASWLRASGDYESLTLEECVRIVASDLECLPHYQALLSRMRAYPSENVVNAVLQALPAARDHCGGEHLAMLMGDLALGAFIPTLVGLLDVDNGNEICARATGALSRLGRDAARAILDSWESLSELQRLHGLDVLDNIGGEINVAHLLRIFPEMRGTHLERWCDSAIVTPDPRLLDALEPELRRKHPVIDRAYVLISAALDEHRSALPAARSRLLADVARLARLRGSLGFDRGGSKTLRMELACRACGDTNFYEVGQVFLSPEAPKSPPYIGGEHACLSCGALDSLEAGGDAMLALTAELFRIKIASEREQEFESPLKLVTSKLADGQLLSVGAAIEWYKKAVAKNPGSLVNTLSLGNCYESVGRRRQAEECFRRCLTIDPACPEAAYALAEILSENDHPGEAFLVLDNAVKHQDQWRFYRLTTITPQEFTVALLEFHEELDPAPRRLSLDPPRSYFAAAGEEPGYRGKTPPNAPCPCGSGRKYKKCCGRMA